MSRTTLRDIAQNVGVSVATVSMALRNHPRIPLQTRKRIQGVAKTMGYVPDPHISELMGYMRQRNSRSMGETLAFISRQSLEYWTQGTGLFYEQYHAAHQRANEMGYNVEFHRIETPDKERWLGRVLKNRGIRGILILPMTSMEEETRKYPLFPWQDFASVTIGFSCSIPSTHRVMCDQIQTLHIALEALRRLGYKKPGLIMEQAEDNRMRNHWSAGFLSCQLRHYDEKHRVPVLLHMNNKEALVNWFTQWRPDAIISTDPFKIVTTLEAAGFKTPQDFAYVTMDKHLSGKWSHHAGIKQNSTHVGKAAIDILIGCLSRNEIGIPEFPQVVFLPVEWADGETVPPRV